MVPIIPKKPTRWIIYNAILLLLLLVIITYTAIRYNFKSAPARFLVIRMKYEKQDVIKILCSH